MKNVKGWSSMIKENDFGSVTDVYTYLKEGFKDICG